LSRTYVDLQSGAVRRPRRLRLVPAFIAFAGRVRVTIALWRSRMRYRRALAQMSERELTDIGVGWSQIAEEASKPFWRG
jgi:uncharacterized protein YjiS (DUF1127 family)